MELVKEIVKFHFQGQKTRIPDDAVQLIVEIVSQGVVEAVMRSGKQAKTEGSTCIQLEHVEKVLAQLGEWKKPPKGAPWPPMRLCGIRSLTENTLCRACDPLWDSVFA